MKIGMIFECGPGGADEQVCLYFAKVIDETIEVQSATLNNKPNLIANCGRTAAVLFDSGCERVLIIWDLYPAWRNNKAKPNVAADCAAIHDSLTAVNVDMEHVYLICIKEELEAWLITTGSAISAVLSRPTRHVPVPDEKNVERIRNPKKVLNKLFNEHLGQRYNDRVHAKRIAQAFPDLKKIRKCPSFAEFERCVEE